MTFRELIFSLRESERYIKRSDNRSNELIYKAPRLCENKKGLLFFRLILIYLIQVLSGSSSGRMSRSRGTWRGGGSGREPDGKHSALILTKYPLHMHFSVPLQT